MNTTEPTFTPKFTRIDRDEDSMEAPAVCYWMHYAGGGLNLLARVARDACGGLPIEVRSTSMPAREDLIDLVYQIDLDSMAKQMADSIAEQRQSRNDQRPFVLVGHSFGSILAYRAATHLIAQGHAAHRLTVLSFPAADQMTHEQALHLLSDESLIEMVDALFGGVPEAIMNDPEAQKFFAPALRFDLGMLERYQHDSAAEKLPIPITAVCGTEDKAVNLAQMQRWQQMTTKDFRLRAMPGDHFFPIAQFAQVMRIAAWEWLDAPSPR